MNEGYACMYVCMYVCMYAYLSIYIYIFAHGTFPRMSPWLKQCLGSGIWERIMLGMPNGFGLSGTLVRTVQSSSFA